MRKSIKKITKRFVAMLMVALLAFGSVTVIPVREAEAGVVSKAKNWIMGDVKYLMTKKLLEGLGEAAENGGNPQVLNYISRKIQSPVGYSLNQVKALCQNILQELNQIEGELKEVNAQNKALMDAVKQDRVNELANKMNAFSGRYESVVKSYTNVLETARQYAEDPSDDNFRAMNNAYDRIETFYSDADGSTDATAVTYRFIEQIVEYVQWVSPYKPSSSYQEKDEWQRHDIGAETSQVYLDMIISYYEDQTASEAQMYEMVSNNLNYAIAPMYYYLQSFQIYTVMKVNDINNDTMLSRSDKEKQIDKAWADFEMGRNYVANAVNQMLDLYEDRLTSYMHGYDVQPTQIQMKYKNPYYREFSTGKLINNDWMYTTTAVKSKKYMGYSILKLRNGSVYAIYADGGSNPSFVQEDMVCVGPRDGVLFGTNHLASADYFNMFQGKGSWSSFKLISNSKELADITNNVSYGATEKNLAKYLVQKENMTSVLSAYTKTNKFYGVTTSYHDTLSWVVRTSNDDVINFYNLQSVSKENPGASTFEKNVEGDITDKSDERNQPISFIMKQDTSKDINLNFKVESQEGADVRVKAVDNSKKISGGNGNYTLAAGNRIELAVKLAEGKEIASAVLMGKNQEGQYVELETFVDEEDISNLKDDSEIDSDGYTRLSMLPMPYRDTKLVVKVRDAVVTHQVKVNSDEKASVQFGYLPGIDSQDYVVGEEVRIDVYPEANYVPVALKMTDEEGNVLRDITVTEDVSDSSNQALRVKTYTFQMPDQNIIVSAESEGAYTASLVARGNDGGLVFTDQNGQEIENAGQVRTYVSGERVYIRALPNKSYYCESLLVRNVKTGQYVKARTENFGISFKMPTDNVNIIAEFAEQGKLDYTVSMTINKKNSADGNVRLDGKATTLGNYKAGDKVTLTVNPEDGSWMSDYSIRRAGSTAEVDNEWAVDKKDYGIQIITFTMPKQNVDIDITLDKSQIYAGTLSVDHGLHGSVTEKIADSESQEILSDIIDGSADFSVVSTRDYVLQVEALDESRVPEVIYTCGQDQTTLQATKQEGTQYTYQLEDITGDFTLDVKNPQPQEIVENTYTIPDYQTLCDYRDKINADTTAEGIYRKATYLLTADIEAPSEVFTSIDTFEGLLDGQGYQIKGLHVERGFIHDLIGTVDGVVFNDINVTTTIECAVGTVAVSIDSEGVIRNCGVTGTVRVAYDNSTILSGGGIAKSNKGMIANSYFAGVMHPVTKAPLNRSIDIGGLSNSSNGTVWNCYVKDGFLDTSEIHFAMNMPMNLKVCAIGGAENSNTYISSEQDQALQDYQEQHNHRNQNHNVTYTNDANTTRPASEMASSSFADELNSHITDYELYATWAQDDSVNDGYPYLEQSDPVNIHDAEVTSVVEGSELSMIDPVSGEAVSSLHDLLPGTVIQMTGATDQSVVQVTVKDVDADRYVLNTDLTPDSDGKLDDSFVMPDSNVEITLSVRENAGRKVTVNTKVVPSNLAEAVLQDESGQQVSSTGMKDTVYVKVTGIEEGYAVSRLVFKGKMSATSYKSIDNPESVLQEDGRYAVTLEGGGELLGEGVTIFVELGELAGAITTEVSPSNGGQISCDRTSAIVGATVPYTVKAANGYYCDSVKLCTEDGTVLQQLDQAQGTFTMPAGNVVVKGVFKTPSHVIDKKNSDNLTLSVIVDDSTNNRYASKGDRVTVHYTKSAGTADEMISVYRAVQDASGAYQPDENTKIASWVAQGLNDNAEKPLTFTMPDEDVIVVSVPMNDVSYKLSTEVSGSGDVELKDAISGSKTEAYQGEDIYASAYADRGWAIDVEHTKAYDTKGQVVNVNAVQDEGYMTFAMPAMDLVVKAAFVQNEYTIRITTPEKGTITVTDQKGNAIDLNKAHYDDLLKVKVTGVNMDSVHYTWKNEEDGTLKITNLLLDANGEASFYMPDQDITIEEGAAIDQDANGVYQISTFDDFMNIPSVVAKNHRANFELTNNISGEGATLTEMIGSENMPYNGTFDGHGYSVGNFNIVTDDGDAALFNTIGKEGTVKRLSILNTKVTGKEAAGIALTNYGTIDECISGFNMVGPYIDKDGANRNLSEFNAFITGETAAGGVVVTNYGMIRNTANYAQTTASGSKSVAAGIAALNGGTIENVYTRAKISAGTVAEQSLDESSIAGGIVGTMMYQGTIDIAYAVAEELTGAQTGSIYGYKESQTVNHTYYKETDSDDDVQGIAMTEGQMRNQSFADTLNTCVNASDDKANLCAWYWQSAKNQNYPVLSYSTLVQKQVAQTQRGVTIAGTMHEDAQLSLNQLETKDTIYKAFKKYAKANGLQIQYAARPFLQYRNGDPAAYLGTLKLNLDTSKYEGKTIKVLLYRDGQVEEVTVDAEKLASTNVKELMPFAVLSEQSASADKNTPTKTDKKGTISTTKAPKTGDESRVWLWGLTLILAGAVIGVCMVHRRRKQK